MKIMVNNCLSHEVDRLFRGAILKREVLYKNKILYDIDIQDKVLFECFMKHRHPTDFKAWVEWLNEEA